MSEIRFEPRPVHGLAALAVVVALVLVKIATLGETGDPKLHAAIERELMNHLGGRIGQEIDTLDTEDEAAVAAFTARARPDGIEVHSASVSKPLLAVGTRTKAVVRIEYTLPDGPRETVYWRMEHSTIAGWRYHRPTFALMYYLNFL